MSDTPKINYLRQRQLPRFRHSTDVLQWLEDEATRLDITVAEVFALLHLAAAQVVDNAELPENTEVPAITGTTTEGEVLTSSTGTWTGSPTPVLSYQWQRDAVDIEDATEQDYTLVTADVNAQITVVVTGTNLLGTDTATSAQAGPVAGI